MNHKADIFFTDGCGRCPLGGTPDCKVHNWQPELALLRKIILDCGLDEQLKWGVPCYTLKNKNVIILSAFKESCVVSFLKGALLHDELGILSKAGENTQAARIIRFTGMDEIAATEAALKAYIFEAIDIEKSGKKVTLKKTSEYAVPDELQQKLNAIPAFKKAFEALTPGRQRGYLLYFSAPKQSQTRTSRIEKNMQRILEGKGLNDR